MKKKNHSRKPGRSSTVSGTAEKNKIACLLMSLALCSTSFAHYIVNPFGLSAATMLTVSLTSIGASALPLVVSSAMKR